MKKEVLSVSFALLLAISLIAGGCAQPAPTPAPTPAPAPAPAPAPPPDPTPKPETVILKAVTFANWDSSLAWGYRELIKRFNERAKGAAFIQYLGGPEVVPGFPQGMAVKDGSIDMSSVYAAAYFSFVPEAKSMNMSRILPLEERESGYYDFLAEKFRAEGVFYLGRYATEYGYYIFLNRKVESYRDLVGLKIHADNDAWTASLDNWGAVPLRVADPEIYTALETGLIDGQMDPVNDIVDYSLYEVLDYVISHRLLTGNVMTGINLNAWNQLSPKMQELMIEVQLELEEEMVAYYQEWSAGLLDQLVELGIEVITFSETEASAYLDGFFANMWEATKEGISPEDLAKMKAMTGN